MKHFEIVLVVLAIVFIAALIGIMIQVLAAVISWPIWWLFELYGEIL